MAVFAVRVREIVNFVDNGFCILDTLSSDFATASVAKECSDKKALSENQALFTGRSS
jgi:hypothetical protein